MRFEIKQAVLSSSMVAEVNSVDTHPDFWDDYLNVTSRPNQERIEKARYLYQTVGFIEAENYYEVFHKGNVWEGYEDDFEHVGVGMHSVSVGDLLIDEDGECVVVAGLGFEKIDFKKEEFSNYK